VLNASNRGRRTKDKQLNKFEWLEKRIYSTDQIKHNTVVNISSHQIDNRTMNSLEKGLGFAITPHSIPVEDIICRIEDDISGLPEDSKDEIRQDVALTLKQAKLAKKSLKKEELNAVLNLQKNENLFMM